MLIHFELYSQRVTQIDVFGFQDKQGRDELSFSLDMNHKSQQNMLYLVDHPSLLFSLK